MKKLFTLFVFAIAATSVFSQTIDLNSYKYRFQKYRGFFTNYSIGGGNSVLNNQFNSTADTTVYDRTSDMPGYNFSGNIRFGYFSNTNTDARQRNISANIDGQAYFSGSKVDNNEGGESYYQNDYFSKNTSTRAQFNYNFNGLNRWYKPNNHFNLFEANVIGNMSINNFDGRVDTNQVTFQSMLNKQLNNSSTVTFRLGKGVGRLDLVTDAVSAMFLVEDLVRKANVKNVSDAQMLSIAQGITKILNTRFIDFRFRLIDQITMLDSVLKANGINSENSIQYVTTIYDNWLYANRYQRYTGARFTYNLLAESMIYNSNNSTTNRVNNFESSSKNNFFNNGLGLELDYTFYKQLSTKKQVHYGVNAIGLYNRNFEYMNANQSGNDLYNSNGFSSRFNAKVGYLYQPNSRNYVFVDFSTAYRQLHSNRYDKSNVKTSNNDNYRFDAGVSLNYFKFISQRLNYSFGVSINTIRGNNTTKNTELIPNSYSSFNKDFNFSTSFSAGLNYVLY